MISTDLEPRVSYVKRFRMEMDLQIPLPPPLLPESFSFVAWSDALLEVHAEINFQCFLDELDAQVFPSLGCRAGCSYLMREIRKKPGFRPEATWLLASAAGYCGTVQGVGERPGTGSVQNLGIVAGYRGRGLGNALLLQALHGFRRAGMHRAVLEVTAQNDGALRLYRRLGFRCRKTLYKAVAAEAVWSPLAQEATGSWYI